MQTASIWLKQKPSSKVAKSKSDTRDAKVVSLTEEEEKQLARSRYEYVVFYLISL